MSLTIHDTTRCLLGEGAFWHPERGQFFWCDILSRRVLTREGDRLRSYDFDRFVSCLAWVDRDRLAVATSTDMTLLDLETGAQEHLVPLEADNPATRANDGRVDPSGGLWISTMALDASEGAGAIYRFHKGTLVKLIDGLTIPNSICFSPGGEFAYFSDTPTGIIRRWRLSPDGTPKGSPESFIDGTSEGFNPDGAVCDRDGRLWVAHWGAGRVAVHDADGQFEKEVRFPATQITCPAFGGADLSTLYATSAAAGLPEETLIGEPDHGRTFAVPGVGTGQAEHRLIL